MPIATFDYSKILDSYEAVDYTEEEANEIARFYQYVEMSLKWGIFEGKLIEMTWNVDNIQKEYYEIDSHYAKYDELLESRVPLFQMNSSHDYNLDGRDSKGLYHVNFGWGGYYDGYYVFPDKCTEETFELLRSGDLTMGSSGLFYIVPKG